ncbi:uncharacterized protein KD926_010504 [Aspergillus affinis]|uniref:uncharacterized protein n=1 Tax=Aspergillus affinis TaxID=1070780 RepID=UPI0022FDD199|nr:uncharacterized protein KD926_010504 [Aspergillus affinis]KAI9038769.1 hypothetical protein KD926_010504 [Aspergillus affinis]
MVVPVIGMIYEIFCGGFPKLYEAKAGRILIIDPLTGSLNQKDAIHGPALAVNQGFRLQSTRLRKVAAVRKNIILRLPQQARSQASRKRSSRNRSNKQRSGGRHDFTVNSYGIEMRDLNSYTCGRMGYLVKATLLTHGYIVIIKATTAEKQDRLQAEVKNYNRLRDLQGQQIPVCLGAFKPSISYWYHGELMAQIIILGWSGMRLQHVINEENSSFFDLERKKVLAVLRSHGIIHDDSEWRNTLWDDAGCHLVIIDLEDMKWLTRPRALEPASGNTCRVHRVRDEKAGVCA